MNTFPGKEGLFSPLSGILSPFLQQSLFFWFDISSGESLGHDVLVVGNGYRFDIGIAESLYGHGEAIRIAGHHADDFEASLSQGVNGFQ